MLSSHILLLLSSFFFFFFNDTATTEIYTLSLHDALPIYVGFRGGHGYCYAFEPRQLTGDANHQAAAHATRRDRKSTRLNSSHSSISYAVFCLKKKKKKNKKKHDKNKTYLIDKD